MLKSEVKELLKEIEERTSYNYDFSHIMVESHIHTMLHDVYMRGYKEASDKAIETIKK